MRFNDLKWNEEGHHCSTAWMDAKSTFNIADTLLLVDVEDAEEGNAADESGSEIC